MRIGGRQMQDNVLDVPNLDVKIYRIFSIPRFIELITTNELALQRYLITFCLALRCLFCYSLENDGEEAAYATRVQMRDRSISHSQV